MKGFIANLSFNFSGASRVLNTQSGPPAKKQRTDSGTGGIKRTLVNLTSGTSSSTPASKTITQLAQGKKKKNDVFEFKPYERF